MDTIERVIRTLLAVDGVLTRSACACRSDRGCHPKGIPGQLELGLADIVDTAKETGAASSDAESAGCTDKRRASQALPVERSLRALGGDIWESFEYALRTDLPVEEDAAAFAALALIRGLGAAADRSRPEVRVIRGAAFKVRREVHRLLGLLRFEPDSMGVFTARCEPDNDILDLLFPAFRRRFGADPFRIIDLRRGTVVESEHRARSRPECGRDITDLWRAYYKAAENPSRTNHRLRLQYMPQRYWKHLPEVDA